MELEELENFTGSENYYLSSFGKLNLTDGMNYLRNKANCYWLIDIVESVQYLDSIKANNGFIVWRLERVKERGNYTDKWLVTAWNDTPNKSDLLYSQAILYSDFPLNELEFFQNGNVLLLKSEY